MRAAEFASLVGARRTGTGRWLARCPAHDDHSPSLSISEGRDGRVLVRCWAGCLTAEVVKALGIRMTDLFNGPPATAEQLRAARTLSELRQAEERKKRIKHGQICELHNRLERVSVALARKLAITPDNSPQGEIITQLFHRVEDRIRSLEMHELETRP